jgi:hypothetical protein
VAFHQGRKLIVALDANCLITWSASKGDSLDRSRLEHLLAQVGAAGGKIIIPTQSLAEFLVRTDAASSDWLAGLERKRSIYVAPFDRRAAFECALMDRAALGNGDKKHGRKDPWQRIKIDRQIVGVARAHRATSIITNDEGLRSEALTVGLLVQRVSELELPSSALQIKLDLGHPDTGAAGELSSPPPSAAPAA